MIKIDKKISKVAIKDTSNNEEIDALSESIQMSEKLKRPSVLHGTTYKIKTPDHVSNHALYITINDIILNEGTDAEEMRPFEIFINTKSMQNFESKLAMTRLMSAIFRKGGDVSFIINELRSVFAPEGGYWNKGKFQKSIWSEIGDILEIHFQRYDNQRISSPEIDSVEAMEDSEGTPDKPLKPACPSCGEHSMVISGGCETCGSCGYSKCG